jgi:hypothetical protein
LRYYDKYKLKDVLDFLIWLLSADILQQIIHLTYPIILPFVIDTSKLQAHPSIWGLFSYKEQKNFIEAFLAYVIIIVIFYIINFHRHKEEKGIWFSQEVKYQMVDIISSMTEHIRQCYNNQEKLEIFDALSQMVCTALYILLTKYYPDREVRVSVVKQYCDHRYYYYMPGYKSRNHSRGDCIPNQVTKCNKYIKKILESQDENYIILNENDIKEQFEFKKEKAPDKKVKQYIAVPYKGPFERTCFVLQIDFSKRKSCGNNEEEIKCFINEYIRPFVELLAYGYIIELTNGDEKEN